MASASVVSPGRKRKSEGGAPRDGLEESMQKIWELMGFARHTEVDPSYLSRKCGSSDMPAAPITERQREKVVKYINEVRRRIPEQPPRLARPHT